MLDLPDLRDVMPEPKLELIIAGHHYDIPGCTVEDYNRMNKILDELRADGDKADVELTTDELQILTLGAARQAMIDGGARYAEITRSAWTAFYWHLDLDDVARTVWAGPGEDEPAKPSAQPAATPAKKVAARRR